MFCREERGSKEVKAGTWEECKRRNGPNARRREKPGPAPKILKEDARSKRYKNAPERGASGGVAGGFVFCWILHRNLQEPGRTAEPAKSGAFCLQKQEERKRHNRRAFFCFREKGLKKIAGGAAFTNANLTGIVLYERERVPVETARIGPRSFRCKIQPDKGGDGGRRFQTWHCSRIARATIPVPSAAVAAQFLRKVSALAASVSNSA